MARTDDPKAMNATVAKAKEQFCDIVSRAEAGKVTTVTRHNKPVTCIVPAMLPAKKLTEEWRQRRKAIRLNRPGLEPLSISQLIQEGRK